MYPRLPVACAWCGCASGWAHPPTTPGNNATAWTIIERTAFVEITGRYNFGRVVFATGWDAASVILKVLDPSVGHWKTYRLPKASHAWDHLWCVTRRVGVCVYVCVWPQRNTPNVMRRRP